MPDGLSKDGIGDLLLPSECECHECRKLISTAVVAGWVCDTCGYRGRPNATACACYDHVCSPTAPGSGCFHGALECPLCESGSRPLDEFVPAMLKLAVGRQRTCAVDEVVEAAKALQLEYDRHDAPGFTVTCDASLDVSAAIIKLVNTLVSDEAMCRPLIWSELPLRRQERARVAKTLKRAANEAGKPGVSGAYLLAARFVERMEELRREDRRTENNHDEYR